MKSSPAFNALARAHAAWLLGGVLLLTGCAPFKPHDLATVEKKDEDPIESPVRLVGDVTLPYGLNYVKIEGVALVTHLAKTGSDPALGVQRTMLINDMQARNVPYPAKILASPENSLVWVSGLLPPGVQKGDHYDIEVRVPPGSDTTSLRGGWLMETRLQEMAILGGQVRDGHLLGLAQGSLLVDPSANEKNNKDALLRGRILGGGVALKSRPLGLALKPDDRSVRTSSMVGMALNRRFNRPGDVGRQGVATPHTDEQIELAVHPRYKDNLPRYLRVVRSVPLTETPNEQLKRLQLLERQLLEPVTSANAALRLEAIGKEGIHTLHRGLESKEPDVRFYSAEALAYLDDASSSVELGAAAKNQPAFRVFALTALSTLNDVASYEQLRALLDVPSAETRYGAFRALRAMNDQDGLVRGEWLGDHQFSYHLIKTDGPPMVHVTRHVRPELVVFGPDQWLRGPAVIEAGSIMIKIEADHTASLSKFVPNQPDQKRTISSKLDEVIRTVVELGGSYPDVVQALEQAKSANALEGRFEVDALPAWNRQYDHSSDDAIGAGGPIPNLFADLPPKDGDDSKSKGKDE